MVMTVMAAVCTLLGQKTDWSTAKLLLGEQGFLKRLVGYDRDSVTNRIYDRVKKITKNPDFNPTAIGKISKACKSMCAWVLALQNYTEVHRMVLPKQQRCKEAQEALSVAYENLRQKRSALKQVLYLLILLIIFVDVSRCIEFSVLSLTVRLCYV